MIDIRTGIGVDIHKFDQSTDFGTSIEEKALNSEVMNDMNSTNDDLYKNTCYIMLGGIEVANKWNIIAHSDGDVVLHALTEALLGSIAAGNIGMHFPSNEKWKDAKSELFVKHAYDMVKLKNGYITNIDVSIICEMPKVMPYAIQIRQNIAKILEIDFERISIKATTTEKMGFLGKAEGIAAIAICTVVIGKTFS